MHYGKLLSETALSPQKLVTVQTLKIPCIQPMAYWIVHTLLHDLQCATWKKELLLDPYNPTAANMIQYAVYAKFTQWKQYGKLVLPSPAVLKILKAAEVIFKRRVIDTERGIITGKMIDLK